ncbi:MULTISPECIES: aspartate/glutamate racemase family protein [unclassified Gilliamella]|uniref:aspartate/glutamate racemase family protein n=1 Tax=unclassified Gilliamella TaxID=2685620 RepID=UPI002269A3EA|nr:MULTISPECIES: aspartate/glutamate racemase family protein [unclassified Gilliamella]MCX8643045.1 aspartate/glutamate racemase family protein [Gilliamella sp. B3835]MCX8708436.1 aspartate/glutamate racemase family protein [Gilliamella sp. B3783]MCX8709692.1 aspartate/glutamate racemase family protein [Gilliamella sp. B3780]MCX8714120.1 aspartate/glutamate racemase family protein [Gilliamella sp. B3781]MCX8717632.1 aspartate/glutamate racemase family protein [Gilliamella sp. B3784]
MKTIGLIGGMSWESTVTYYQVINQMVAKSLGGLHSAKTLLYSVDFQEIELCQANGEWDKSALILIDAAKKLQIAGADFIVICTNTMHKVADQIQAAITIPIIHIADVTAKKLIQQGIKTVALLGTKYTMEQDFYKSKLIDQGLIVLIPDQEDRNVVNQIIYDELCKGIIKPASKQAYLTIVDKLVERGAQGVILGCTEIGLLISQSDRNIPFFDTALIHAEAAAMLAISH